MKKLFKGLGKLFIGLCGFFGCFLLFGGCCAVLVDNGITMQTIVEGEPDVEKFNIQNVKAYSNYGMMTVTGALVADRDYSYLQIEIPCYDSEGNKVGTALANINNVNKGETWKFEAIDLSGSATKYSINKAEVTGW
jgi:hypothetical protein